MNNFLDKVGLQHVIEKIKGLLSGYLPLEKGGTIGTGAPTTTLKAGNITIEGVGYNASSPETSIKKKVEISEKSITGTSSDKTDPTFQINDSGITAKKFVLSENADLEGLIANNSSSVVSKLNDEDCIKLFYTGATNQDSKYAGAIAINGIPAFIKLSSAQMFITVTQDTEAVPLYQNYICNLNIRIKISKNTNVFLDKDIWMISNPEYVESIVVKGLCLTNCADHTNLKTFKSNGIYLLGAVDLVEFFKNDKNLTYVDINDLVTNIVTSLSNMFYFCSALSNITLNKWDTRNVKDTSGMFDQCHSLENLDITGWDMTNVTNMEGMFNACFQMKNLLLSEGFGRMKDEVGTLNLSTLTRWTNESVQTLLTLYDRKANGMGVITIKLSEATKSALGTSGIQTLTAKGYTIA